MSEASEELYSLLVPLHEGRLIVPRSCVAEVVRYTMPEHADSGPDWFYGFLSWNNLQVPIIRIETMCGLDSTEPGGRTRVAIFNSISGELEGGFFGILTEGFPQLVRVNREVMELHEDKDWPDDGPVICQIRMINEYPLIPDLDVIEQNVQQQVLDAA